MRHAPAASTVLAAALVVASCGSTGGRASPDAGAAQDAGHPLVDATFPADAPGVDASPPLDASVPPGQPPPLLLGYDAYRGWTHWPYLRLGERTVLRSTADRSGGNEASDASHFVREEAPGRDVSLDLEGRGVFAFFRANHWHGSPWELDVDGQPQVVTETATATPDNPPATSTFLPVSALPAPLALTYSTTQGADVSWVPVGFTRSLTLAYGHSHYGTGYYVATVVDPDAPLASPLTPWTTSDVPPADVLALLSSAGSDLAPTGAGVTTAAGTSDVPATGAVTLADLTGPATVRLVRLTVPDAAAVAVESAHLRITWDGRPSPSVDAPVPLLFGAGTLYNRNNAAYLVKSLPAVIQQNAGSQTLSLYFPMPFTAAAHVELVGGGAAAGGIGWEVRTIPSTDAPATVGAFHATYVDHGTPVAGHDLVFLDTTQTEGGGDACGTFVGTSFVFSDRADLGTLEGDPRFFFDDSQTPQAQGTGSEEWGAGGDYWGGQVTTLPLAGHPVGAPSLAAAANARDAVESEYRFLLADAFPFGKNARIQFEHGGTDDSTEHYRSVAYWYGNASPCLVQTDALHVGDTADEAAHQYSSPQASGVDTLTSRYDWGVDHVGAQEVYPATTDTGRHTTGTTELTLAVRPDNFGVLLRRKLDDGYPDQRAEVYVADTTAGATFQLAGVWYTAGSNTCAFVDASSETGTATPLVETSNRQWRDDEFLLPRGLTRGRSSIRVRFVFSPRSPAMPVAPGQPVVPSAWSEYRYTALSYVLPGSH